MCTHVYARVCVCVDLDVCAGLRLRVGNATCVRLQCVQGIHPFAFGSQTAESCGDALRCASERRSVI